MRGKNIKFNKICKMNLQHLLHTKIRKNQLDSEA